jgi:hypothetical protein
MTIPTMAATNRKNPKDSHNGRAGRGFMGQLVGCNIDDKEPAGDYDGAVFFAQS